MSSIHPFAIVGDKPDKKFAIRNLGTKTDIASAPGILDLDASPVGRSSPTRLSSAATRSHIVDFAGSELDRGRPA